MAVKKLSDVEVKTYYGMLVELGEDNFHARLIGQGVMRFAAKVENPDIDLLDLAESFFAANRREQDEILFAIGKIVRRAAHTLNRRLAKVRASTGRNPRFLNVVR